MVLLPTPPLALATAMTLDTSLMRCFGGNPRVRLGIVPVKGSPAHRDLETLMLTGRWCPKATSRRTLSLWQRMPVIIRSTPLETRYCRKRSNQRPIPKARGQLAVELLFRPRNLYLRETVDQFGGSK